MAIFNLISKCSKLSSRTSGPDRKHCLISANVHEFSYNTGSNIETGTGGLQRWKREADWSGTQDSESSTVQGLRALPNRWRPKCTHSSSDIQGQPEALTETSVQIPADTKWIEDGLFFSLGLTHFSCPIGRHQQKDANIHPHRMEIPPFSLLEAGLVQ